VLVEQYFLTLQRDVLKRDVRLLVVHLAARGLQRTLLGSELGLVLGKLRCISGISITASTCPAFT
jgi:hypothetical protein